MESDYPDSEPTGLHRAQTYNTSSDDSGSEDERELLPDLLKGILRDIDHATIRFPLDDFTQQRCDELASHGTGKGASSNALHLLVFDLTLPKMVTTSALKELVTFLVQHPNKLMERKDHQGYTPLMRAIEAKKMDDMVGWMCDAHPNIDAVLAICKDKRENCLHVAVQKRHACLSKLIEKASPKTVAARDSKGNTPLHWAAEYKRCRNDTWLSVVKQLVAKGDDIVKNSVEGDLNNAGLSPYLRHIESRMHDEARREIDTSQDMVRTKDMLEGRLPFRQLSRESGEESAAFESLSASRPANPEKTSRYNRSTAAYRDTRMESRSPLHLALRGGLRFIPPEGLEEKQARKLKAQDERSVNHKKSRVDKKVAESVQQFLKLHYLRSRSENDCRDILYHSDFTPGFQDLVLNLDLSGRTGMTEEAFSKLISQLKFETVLQYVAVPKIIIENTRSSNVNPTQNDESTGRHDLSRVFESLRSKNVCKILKVVVDDTLTPPHSDKVIEDSLRPMMVEVWDWKRIDLCSEVIYNAVPTAREVYLYSSGNNAVLRSWSEEGGLKKLKSLETVHLHVETGIETKGRMKLYLDEFTERMKKTCPNVTVHIDSPAVRRARKANVGVARANGRISEPTTKNDWMICMKEFRRLLMNAENNHKTESGMKVWQSIETPITVALIDDGVDITQLELDAAPLISGRTFCTRDEVKHLSHPHYASSTGHGTHMAQSIHAICPRAQFFILRLEDYPSEDGSSRHITAKSAAQAVRAAVKQNVHIISMSWTVDIQEDEAAGQELESAIKSASDRGILMFCSASDNGANFRDTFPAKATQSIFKIGAAKDSGAVDEWVGDLNRIDFTFPGNKVDLEGRQVSGSSVATAHAAGLAALILYCVQVRLFLATDKAEKAQAKEDFEAMRKHAKMYKTFNETIGTTAESKHKFVKVWETFGAPCQKQDKQPDRLLELVAEVGTKLCMKL